MLAKVSEEEVAEREARNSQRMNGALTVDELAGRLVPEGRGLKRDTLYKIEGGPARWVPPRNLQAIATACGLPYAFFTVDLQRLPELDLSLSGLDEDEERTLHDSQQPNARTSEA
jgi:hypothetical protein